MREGILEEVITIVVRNTVIERRIVKPTDVQQESGVLHKYACDSEINNYIN